MGNAAKHLKEPVKLNLDTCTKSLKHPVTDDISKYYILKSKILGEGAFSVVKLAIGRKNGFKYAVKVIDKASVRTKPERMEAEVAILLSVDHPYIIKLYDVFDSERYLYMVMELVSGGELFDRICKVDFYTEGHAKEIVRELLSALQYLHANGIAHRDLKPENLLLLSERADSSIKIGDFGLSRIYSDDTLMTTACGTPEYAAPEILRAEKYDKEVDLWSLGVIMYILLSGYPPFYSREGKQYLFEIILAGKYEFHSPFWDEISDDAKDLISKLLVVNPKKRITAAQALKHPWLKGVEEANKKELLQRSRSLLGGSLRNSLLTHNRKRKEKRQKRKKSKKNKKLKNSTTMQVITKTV